MLLSIEIKGLCNIRKNVSQTKINAITGIGDFIIV